MYRILLTAIVAIITTTSLQAQDINERKGIALEGYDLVSYFEGNAEKGDKTHAASYMGVTYHFTTAEHLATFKNDPERYLPEYGGYCAYAIAVTGDKVSVNPKTYEIRDDKLYLFYNAWGNNTLKKWLKDPENLRQQADANWQ